MAICIDINSIVVDKSAQVFLNDQKIELPALADALQKSAKANPETEVQLRADEAVPYGKVVAVMGVAQKAGLNRIGFIADPVVDAVANAVANPVVNPAAVAPARP